MTKDLPETDVGEIRQVVGLDFGLNLLVTAYDSPCCTTFFCSLPAIRESYRT